MTPTPRSLLALALLCSSVYSQNPTGCQKALEQYCSSYHPKGGTDVAKCLECVDKKWDKLKNNCTREKAEYKCTSTEPAPPGPSPSPLPPVPPAPDLPPLQPIAGAPRPHLVLFVVDDMGWAALGKHNPGNVLTPNMDREATVGIMLERHYAYRWCSPSRSSLMTGRLPYHVLQDTNYVDRRFNMMAAKLKQVGYSTHQFGKWHMGAVASWMTPHARGFDSSLGYLTGAEDHYTQLIKSDEMGGAGVDLYQTDRPAYGLNGTYASYTYNEAILETISKAEHNKSIPLFLYIALQVMHAPEEVTEQFQSLYDPSKYISNYAVYNGMGAAADSLFGNVTQAMKDYGMWNHTLLLMTSDNGGPTAEQVTGGNANNWPLRGGKQTEFEGGVRVNAFLAGGFVPQGLRGSTLDGYMHLCDWYATFLPLAGANATDDHPGVPSVDGLDLWPYITGKVSQSPRTEMMLSNLVKKGKVQTAALIVNNYKLILGVQIYGFWQGPVYPNASTDHKHEDPIDCTTGCVFDIIKDPTEHQELSESMPGVKAMLMARFAELNVTTYQAPKFPLDTAKCESYVASHRGFVGPYYGE